MSKKPISFGFTRSLDETWRLWPKDVLFEDALQIARRFRPQMVVAQFSGTPNDGHGQHQASGIVGKAIYEALAAEKSPLNLSAISQRLGRSSGELFRMLQVLEFKGFITTAENGSGYVLTAGEER